MVTKAEVIYYAKDHETGEIWESENFKSLCHAIMYTFNRDLKDSLFFNVRSVFVEYGVVKHYDDGTCRYDSFRTVCYISACAIDKTLHRATIQKY